MESLRFEFQSNSTFRARSFTAPLYRGRNGDGFCTGISMLVINPSETPHEILRLSPYNSKGDVSSTCFFDIPGNTDTIKDVAVALIRVAAMNNPGVVAEVQQAMIQIAKANKENTSSYAHT